MEDEKPSYYSIITADVRYDERLKPNEKLLYSEITALSNKYGYCTATNSYFSKLYRADKSTVSRWVSHLEKCGYVQVEQTRNGKRIVQRKIYPVATPLLTKKSIPYAQKDQYPIDKKVKGNITRVNTTSMNMRERIKQPLDTNSKLSLLSWPDSLGAMTDQISKLLLDASDQGMSIDLLQKAVNITKYADPGTSYGYLKSVVSDWLSQGIYTMQDWQQHQQKKQAAKHRDIPDIPIYKI
ncbi:helix-turn-helix domain-containing protein [Limosilactobacillus mucosae]|uniref:helix-turn-helix domain-containing protein n=1 Tax=Limosilactobacillus mucosae TaxID=97478 RepID=UPI0025A35171|nr:helix-turn-helix domain-containing protein [Limosilactobacillus mucosae]MDM8220026.1 helix-turn-helix domain-containing protein [Limosilactobacillus mucosae]MDM8314682.1 helix-turn-helix domain-containing protein [Limosilactobacillus mucosae]